VEKRFIRSNCSDWRIVKLYGEDDAGGGKIDLTKKKALSKDLDRAFFCQNGLAKSSRDCGGSGHVMRF